MCVCSAISVSCNIVEWWCSSFNKTSYDLHVFVVEISFPFFFCDSIYLTVLLDCVYDSIYASCRCRHRSHLAENHSHYINCTHFFPEERTEKSMAKTNECVNVWIQVRQYFITLVRNKLMMTRAVEVFVAINSPISLVLSLPPD